eukprot:CAMPEP_0113664776 /NCGR_PEP_ID=MMETSP0038_2-20120614/1929_1 /TAXON_ID=2898 /ORGANISM="Cryptomonas paramecium" /LENGTH=305 /DNA_ID=CAMNT_0000580039 /DNA_START=59 /DNA_END=973 /DNA_ORIENTATION=- /assembly_acc=CAM_ASM_000170
MNDRNSPRSHDHDDHCSVSSQSESQRRHVEPNSDPRAGVGLFLKLNPQKFRIEVSDVAHRGPVYLTGRVRVGDVLRKVCGRFVGDSLSTAKDLILGEPGTKVDLTFCRPETLFGIEGLRFENEFTISVNRGYSPSSPSESRVPSSSSACASNRGAPASHSAVYDLESEISDSRLRNGAKLMQDSDLGHLLFSLETQMFKVESTFQRYQNELIRLKETNCRLSSSLRHETTRRDFESEQIVSQIRDARRFCNEVCTPRSSGEETETIHGTVEDNSGLNASTASLDADGTRGGRVLVLLDELAGLRR